MSSEFLVRLFDAPSDISAQDFNLHHHEDNIK
jgi:hypothetical protein